MLSPGWRLASEALHIAKLWLQQAHLAVRVAVFVGGRVVSAGREDVARPAADVLPHDEQHAGADQRVLDDERKQVRRRLADDGAHDVDPAARLVPAVAADRLPSCIGENKHGTHTVRAQCCRHVINFRTIVLLSTRLFEIFPF